MVKFFKIHLTSVLIFTMQFSFTSCFLFEKAFNDQQNSKMSIRADKTLTAVEDAYVRKDAGNQNFGKVKKLKMKSNDSRETQALIKFQVPNIPNKIVKAALKISVSNSTNNGPKIYKTSNTWNENSITWDNKPAPTGSIVINPGSLSKGLQTIDVTSAVVNNSTLSFILIPESSDSLNFSSKESGDKAPQLVIETDADNGGGGGGGGDGGGNTGSGKFTVTSVNDDLDNSDGQDFVNGYKSLGYTFSTWNKNVSTSALKGYMQTSQEMVFHTGHGNTGIIATSDGSLNTNGLTVNSKYFISATCLTMANTAWKNVFGENTQAIMGYTKVSFDKPTDNEQVAKFIQQLKSGSSHQMAFYKSNAAISSLKDRWCVYAREGSKIVEYSARTNNTPSRTFSGDPVTLYDNVTVNESLLNSSTRFDRAYQVTVIDEISSPVAVRADRNTWPSTPTSLDLAQATNIAQTELTTRGGLPASATFERIVPIERCADSVCDRVAYQAYYMQQYNGYDVTSNIGTDYISLLVDDMGVNSMDIAWSQITPIDPGTDTYTILNVSSALNRAGQSISQLIRGNAVNIIGYENVYGVQTDDDGETLLVPAYQFITQTGEMFVVSAITGQLVF